MSRNIDARLVGSSLVITLPAELITKFTSRRLANGSHAYEIEVDGVIGVWTLPEALWRVLIRECRVGCRSA